MAHKILVLHGPNLNLLGTREPQIYGSRTLKQINDSLTVLSQKLNVSIETYQNNSEGALVDQIHKAALYGINFIIINAGAYTHTSVAIRDALVSVALPCIEVHLSNIQRREAFRHHSYLSDIAVGVICGLGEFGYEAALRFAAQH